MVNAVAALHNAARRYCIEQIDHWHQACAALDAAGESEIRTPEGGWTYTEKAYGLFPRYIVLKAILSDVERLEATDLGSLEEAREWLALAGHTAQNAFATNPDHPTAERAMAEERDSFVFFVEYSHENDWQGPPLPYRRVLRTDEADALYQDFCTRWGRWADGTAPQTYVDQCLTVRTGWVDEDDPLPGVEEALRSELSDRGITRLIEIRESGDSYEVDVEDTYFSYKGAEGYWFVADSDWMIYASHEGTITFGGEWLIEAVVLRCQGGH